MFDVCLLELAPFTDCNGSLRGVGRRLSYRHHHPTRIRSQHSQGQGSSSPNRPGHSMFIETSSTPSRHGRHPTTAPDAHMLKDTVRVSHQSLTFPPHEFGASAWVDPQSGLILYFLCVDGIVLTAVACATPANLVPEVGGIVHQQDQDEALQPRWIPDRPLHSEEPLHQGCLSFLLLPPWEKGAN
jgi:hypothetical protein